jgi:phasin family protein
MNAMNLPDMKAMFTTPEQVTEFNKASLETAMSLTKIAFDAAERMISLNLEASKETFADVAKTAQALSNVKNPQDLTSMRSKMVEPGAEKALDYSRNLYEIATETQKQLSAIFEEKTAEMNKSLASALDKATKSAPAGSDVLVAGMKAAMTASNAAMDNMTKAAKQMSTMAEANMKATTNAATSAVKAAKSK